MLNVFNCYTPCKRTSFVDMDKAKERRLDAIQATIMTDSFVKVNFDNVAGLAEAKQTLKEAVLFPLVYPHLFTLSLIHI